MIHTKTYAKVFTSNNYRDLNDKWVEVIEFLGQIVAVKIYSQDTGKQEVADLRLTEVKEFRHDIPKEFLIQD